MSIRTDVQNSANASRAIRACGLLCFAAGILLLSTCTFVWAGAHVYQSFESWRFDRVVHESGTSPGISRSPAAESTKPTHLKSSLLGRLEIPRIGLSVMVSEGDDDKTLRFSAGHVPETALPGQSGNIAIAAHRDTFFRPLQNIREDDTITLQTAAGTFRYQVIGLWVVVPEEVEVLDPTAKPSLTLITCYPFHFVGAAPYRFIVRAQQIAPDSEAASNSAQLSFSVGAMGSASPCAGPITVGARRCF